MNNYNQPPQVVYNTTYQNQQSQPQAQVQPQPQLLPPSQTQPNAVGGYSYAPQGGQVQNAPYGYPTSMMPQQNQYSAPMQNPYPAYDFEQEQNMASSKEVLAKLDKLIELTRATMRGEYGSGPNRRNKLGSAYNAVQAIINYIYLT